MEEKYKNEKGKWNLEKIAEDCELELKKIGIPIGKIMEVIIYRDKYVFGRLDKIHTGRFILYIPNAYRNPKHKLEEVKTIICHQLLHSVEGCMDHGKTWEKYAKKVDREYGCHIIEQAASRPKAGVNWDAGINRKEITGRGRCCYLDYTEKLMGIIKECSGELKSIGLAVGNVSEVQFSIDNFSYGKCGEIGDGTYMMCVSQDYGSMDADNFGLKRLICHELLHTCPESDSDPYTGIHGPKWREMARKVEREFGYKIMAQSHTDAVRKASGSALMRYACPNCGAYYDIYDDKDRQDISEVDNLECRWCSHIMNLINTGDMEVLGTAYLLVGEFRDKLRIAEIPIKGISGIGFVQGDSPAGLHDNWNGSFSIDLPEIYRQRGTLENNEFKSYLWRELIRTCDACWDYGSKWEEYARKMEATAGIPILFKGK